MDLVLHRLPVSADTNVAKKHCFLSPFDIMDAVRIHYHKSVAPIAFATEHGQSDITLHESQIDALPCCLYSLTDEGISVVEEA